MLNTRAMRQRTKPQKSIREGSGQVGSTFEVARGVRGVPDSLEISCSNPTVSHAATSELASTLGMLLPASLNEYS